MRPRAFPPTLVTYIIPHFLYGRKRVSNIFLRFFYEIAMRCVGLMNVPGLLALRCVLWWGKFGF